MIARSIRCNLSGPSNNKGNAKPAFVQHAFFASILYTRLRVFIGLMDTAWMIVGSKVVCTTIISTEEYECLLIQLELLEQLKDLSNLPIDHGCHRRISSGGFWPRLIFVNGPRWIRVGDVKQAMRRSVR